MASPRSLFDVVEQHAREAPHAVAAVDMIARNAKVDSQLPDQVTYAELHTAALKLAAALGPRLAQDGARLGTLATKMHRGVEWYCIFFAAARLQAPLVALSCDLPDKSTEQQRNAEILSEHRPVLLIRDQEQDDQDDFANVQSGVSGGVPTMTFAQLWHEASSVHVGRGLASDDEATLCFCYTGGTTKASRCVRVTHRMALHEVAAYPTISKLTGSDRVLQQHSVYWAASAYGEIDIALAFGCALVFCEAWDQDALVAAIQESKATCAGLVPSILSALEPSDVPSLRLVFTWGEALPMRIARQWAAHVELLDLLISTECWLSLCADWGAHIRGHKSSANSSPSFHPVRGVQMRLRPVDDAGREATELLVTGRMVSPGYTESRHNQSAFFQDEDSYWYCTKDCVEKSSDGGVRFSGRADDLVKVGGVWVDIHDLEQKACAVSGVLEAKICDKVAFVVLQSLGDDRSQAFPAVRRLLPPDFLMMALPFLPRKVGTGKVDRNQLMNMCGLGTAGPSDNLKDAQEAELRACKAELSDLERWYRPLYFIGVPATCVYAWKMCLDADGEDGMALSVMAALVGRFCFEVLWRLLCLSFMILSCIRPPKWTSWCHWFPFDFYGVAFCLAALVPDSRIGIVLAAHGIYLCMKSGRNCQVFAWPLVFVVGWPIWARGLGEWWARQGCKGACRWYWRKTKSLGSSLWQRLVKVSVSAAQRFGKWLRLMVKCEGCKSLCIRFRGHVDLKVDSHWYCNNCWKVYALHKECAKCKNWRTQGRVDPTTGDWHCRRCQPQPTTLPENPCSTGGTPGGDVVAQGKSSSGSGSGNEQGGGRGHGSGSGNAQGGHNAWGKKRAAVNTRMLNFTPVDEGMAKRAKCSEEGPLENLSRPSTTAPVEEAGTQNCVITSPWCQLVARTTGWTITSHSDSLVGLDSLRSTKLISALRREHGVRLSRDALRRCTTFGDLVETLENLPVEHQQSSNIAEGREQLAWGMMWHSKCQWILHRDKPLSEATLRIALLRLIQRHSALHSEPAVPMRMFTSTQEALSTFSMLRKWMQSGRSLFGASAFERAWCWAFRHMWPSVRRREHAWDVNSVPLTVKKRTSNRDEAAQEFWNLPTFVPPFQAALAQYGPSDVAGENENSQEGALVHISVTHMFSDGFSIVPILADLAQLVAAAENTELKLPQLPALPDAFAVLEERVLRTINDDQSMRDAMTQEPIGRTRCAFQREVVTEIATMRVEMVSALRQAAKALTVADDIAMLAVLGATLAKLLNRPNLTIASIVPQRDGSSSGDLIGLFADIRLVDVRTEGLSFAGMALLLQHVVKNRLWRIPPVATQFDSPLVNFEWTDFDSKHGFSQMPHLRRGPEMGVCNPIKVAVDQPDRNTWRMRTAFDTSIYGPDDRERFFTIFEECLRQLVIDPLALVWPKQGDAELSTALDGGTGGSAEDAKGALEDERSDAQQIVDASPANGQAPIQAGQDEPLSSPCLEPSLDTAQLDVDDPMLDTQ
jgi:acyl-coenzyme A synthetase/AMP-(fatty) acid ligase